MTAMPKETKAKIGAALKGTQYVACEKCGHKTPVKGNVTRKKPRAKR